MKQTKITLKPNEAKLLEEQTRLRSELEDKEKKARISREELEIRIGEINKKLLKSLGKKRYEEYLKQEEERSINALVTLSVGMFQIYMIKNLLSEPKQVQP